MYEMIINFSVARTPYKFKDFSMKMKNTVDKIEWKNK